MFFSVPPQIAHFDFGEDPTDSGDMVTVICSIHKGDFPIDISWTLNDQKISHESGINIMKTNKKVSQLSIDFVKAEHAGKYTCLARNKAGETEFSSYLRINGTTNTKLIYFLFPFTFFTCSHSSRIFPSVICRYHPL